MVVGRDSCMKGHVFEYLPEGCYTFTCCKIVFEKIEKNEKGAGNVQFFIPTRFLFKLKETQKELYFGFYKLHLMTNSGFKNYENYPLQTNCK